MFVLNSWKISRRQFGGRFPPLVFCISSKTKYRISCKLCYFLREVCTPISPENWMTSIMMLLFILVFWQITLFFIRTVKLDPRLAVLKIFIYLGYIVLNLFLFFLDFLKFFHNEVMVYNTRNWSNDTTEGQKEKKTCLMLIFSTVSQKSRD